MCVSFTFIPQSSKLVWPIYSYHNYSLIIDITFQLTLHSCVWCALLKSFTMAWMGHAYGSMYNNHIIHVIKPSIKKPSEISLKAWLQLACQINIFMFRMDQYYGMDLWYGSILCWMSVKYLIVILIFFSKTRTLNKRRRGRGLSS